MQSLEREKKGKVGISKQKTVTEDLTPCATSSIKYCASAHQSWIQCHECEAW